MNRISLATCLAGWVCIFCLSVANPLHVEAMEVDVNHFTLENGLEVIIKQDKARKAVALQLWVKVGSADETPSQRGISHLIEHMAFKGTERRGVGQIAAEVEALGGDINAYTSWDETVFHITVPSSATAQGLDILTDAVLRPIIDPEELEKEKQVVLEEILEGEERPERKASKLLFETAYVESPYQFPIIGYRETVEKFTREDIAAFRKKWYVPENMFLLVVGDVDVQAVKAEAERLTRDLKPAGFFRPPRGLEPVQREIRSSFVRDKNAREARLHIAYHIPSIKGNDANALDLAGDILGGRENSRLSQEVKKAKRLVNSISCFALTPKDPGLMIISASLDTKNLEAATKAILEEVALLAEKMPPKDELERARIHIESQHVYARETVQGTARSIGNFAADLGDPLYEEKYLRLNEQVSPEDISRVVKNYMAVPNVTVSVLAPADEAPELKVEALNEIVNSSSLKSSVSGDGDLSTRVKTETLPNGLRVVLIEDNSNPVVSFRLAHLGGKRFEDRENEGIMNFLSRMLPKGAAGMTEEQIAAKVDEMGGRLDGFSGYDSYGVYANFFSRYANEGLKLLHLVSSDPTFPQDKFEIERRLIINQIDTEPDRPVQYAVNQLLRLVFPRHPYGFDKNGTLATVAGFTPEDLKRMHERLAVPANTVLTGVGRMDLGKTLETIRDLFGKTPEKPFDEVSVPKEEPLGKRKVEVIRIPRAKVHIAIGYRGTSLADPDRFPLDVLNHVLAGQGGRLFLELRDKQSLAYVVTSFVRPGLDPGIFALYMACDESKADRAVEGLFQQIDLVRKEKISDQELQHAISNLVGNHMINLQSSWARAEDKALNTLYGLGYNFTEEYVQKIKQVTSEQVLDVARRYLDPEQSVLLKIEPKEEE